MVLQPIIPALGMQRKKTPREFKVTPSYTVSLCYKRLNSKQMKAFYLISPHESNKVPHILCNRVLNYNYFLRLRVDLISSNIM